MKTYGILLGLTIGSASIMTALPMTAMASTQGQSPQGHSPMMQHGYRLGHQRHFMRRRSSNHESRRIQLTRIKHHMLARLERRQAQIGKILHEQEERVDQSTRCVQQANSLRALRACRYHDHSRRGRQAFNRHAHGRYRGQGYTRRGMQHTNPGGPRMNHMPRGNRFQGRGMGYPRG